MNKKYKIIYADPPWEYKDKRNKHPRLCGGAAVHYDTMTLKDIKSLPINEIGDENSVLFLWVTFPNLREGLEVMQSWGYTYKTLGFNWIKLNKKNNKPFFGIGAYAKSGSEICIMGVKGKVKAINNSVSSTILSPREEHSKKPDEIRDRIVKLFGDLPRIELFARQKAEGWDALGIELNNKDIREELKDIILNQRYIVKNIITGEVKDYSVKELLEIINVDKTKDFEDYTYLDWKEGLEVLTEWEIVDRL